MVNYCVCAGCTNSCLTEHRVHHFPSRKSKAFRLWVRFVQVKRADFTAASVTVHSVICSAHFTPESYRQGDLLESQMGFRSKDHVRLIADAVPAVHLMVSSSKPKDPLETGAGGTGGPSATTASASRNALHRKLSLSRNPIASAAGIVGSEDQFQGQSTSQTTLSCRETAPCEESCPGITVDLSEFTFDEENNCSNKGGEAGKENNCSNEAGGKAEVENNSSSEEGEEEESEEEKDDRDSDWENQDSDQSESDDSGERGESGESAESDLNSDSELPKKVRQLCPECGAFFFTGKAHTCEYKIKPFSCNVCGKRCTDVHSLKVHSAIHKESYKHLCKFCLAPFKTKLDKHAHEGAHKSSSKPYICPDCSLTFAKIHARNEHLKGHRGPKRYTCPHCASEFPNQNRLERHTMVHTGMKEFVCEFCSRSFNQPGHLKSHLRVHTGEKPFQCQHCDKSFTHNVSLKSHVMRYHKEEASDSGLSGPVKRTKGTIWESTGRPRGRPKRNAATNSIPAVQGEAPDPTTAAETSGKGHLRRDSSEDIDSTWSHKDPSYELTEVDKREESKRVRKSKRKASQRSMTDYIVEKDSESDSDSNPEEEAKKRKVVKSQET